MKSSPDKKSGLPKKLKLKRKRHFNLNDRLRKMLKKIDAQDQGELPSDSSPNKPTPE
tara:strand:- start:49 stop:219 length:171 start_codon:yes stop_codon:yes gene_type:complete